MSEQSIIALVAVAISGIVALGTTLLTYLSQRTERNERYRLSLYPQRLQRYQRAIKWLVDLQNVRYMPVPLKGDKAEEYHRKFRDADSWWQDNCVYLDPGFAEDFRKLVLYAGALAVFDRKLTGRTLNELFDDAWESLWNGMGWKHVDPIVSEGRLGP